MTRVRESPKDRGVTAQGLGARLRELRQARGWTQAQVAELVGVSQTAVSYWESGQRWPQLVDVVALADDFGVLVDELLGRD